MAKTPGRARNVKGQTAFELPEGLEVRSFEGGRTETEDERRQRLRVEFLTFLVKDLLGYLVAFGVIIAAVVYSFWVLLQPDLSAEDRSWAMSVLASTLTALIGFAFGKAMK